jgi:hypothetical protein
MIANQDLERARMMAKAIEDAGHTITSLWVLGPPGTHDPGVLDVFERDRTGVETSDAIVADLTLPSTGVGMELMAAYYHRRRVLIVLKKGSRVSRMLMHMQPKEVVEFDELPDLYVSLRAALEAKK